MPSSYRRISYLVLLLLSCALSPAHSLAPSVKFPEQNGVLVLNESSFSAATQAFDPLIVLFDSPSRYGSTTLLHRFAGAAQAIKLFHWTVSATLRFATLDVSLLTHTLPSELRVIGLPAVLLFHCMPMWPSEMGESVIGATFSNCAATPGGVEVYTGGRSSMEFQRFVLGQPLRKPFEISTKDQLDLLVNSRPFVALFIVDGADSQAFVDCRVLAQIDADSSAYVVTTNSDLLNADSTITLPRIPSLVLFREFGREHVVYSNDWNKAALQLFIQKNRYNLISTYTESEASYYFDSAALGHVLLFSDPNASYHPALVSAAADVASYFYSGGTTLGALRFVVVPKSAATLKNALFVLDDHLPTVLMVGNVTQAPNRVPFLGSTTLGLIQNNSFADALSAEIEKQYPVSGTTDLPDSIPEEILNWRDYSDLFINKKTPIMISQDRPSSKLLTAMATGEQRRLTVESSSVSAAATDRDAFLSVFSASVRARARPQSRLAIEEVSKFDQIKELLEKSGTLRLLVIFHSYRCYSCRQAMDAIRAVPPTVEVTTVAVVDVDRVDIRDWPLRFEWLPGIFLVSSDGHVALPSRMAVTVEGLVEFLRSP